MKKISTSMVRFGFALCGSYLAVGCGVEISSKSSPDNTIATPAPKGTPVSTFSPEIQALIAKYPAWQTIVYQETPVMSQTVIQVLEQKRWKSVRDSATGALQLVESTKLTLAPNATGDGMEYISSAFNLDAPIDFEQFFFLAITDRVPGAFFRSIDNNRFELTSGSGKSHVLFFPAPQENSTAFPMEDRSIGVWAAPLGAFGAMALLPVKDVGYLHHNFDNKIEVVVDVSYPNSHIPELDAALQKWNSAFGTNLFSRVTQKREIDIGDCYSSRKLCVRWIGSEQLPWTGVGGSSQHTFDPDTGSIRGGLVTFTNSSSGEDLKTAPLEDVEKMKNGSGNLNWMASVYMRSNEFIGYAHPVPSMLVETILLHEIGHFNGLAHNFAGSLNGTAENPIDSIMEYIPFSAVHKPKLGKFDYALVEHVYRGKPLPQNYAFCSDFDASGGKTANIREAKANCNAFDVGESVEWYISLARQGNEGVFSTMPSGEKVVDKLGVFLIPESGASNSQRARVTEFLCGVSVEREKLVNELSANLGVELSCAN